MSFPPQKSCTPQKIDETILNPQALIQLSKDIRISMIPVLIEDFEKNAATRMTAITTAIKEENIKTLHHHAHALVGSAATLGCLQLQSLLSAIETACHKNDQSKALELAAQANTICTASITALKDNTKKHPIASSLNSKPSSRAQTSQNLKP